MVHQCPRCELKFASRSEVETHMALDHESSREEESGADETSDATTDEG